jgi:hypothetical protein
MRQIGLRALLTLLLILPTASQQISTHANLVPVPTLVLDQQDKTVFGFQAQDFIIEDEGIQQVTHLDEEPESKPILLVVAVQCGRRASRDFGRIAGLSARLDPVLNAPNSARELSNRTRIW